MKNWIFIILSAFLFGPAMADTKPAEGIHVSMSEDADGRDILDGGFVVFSSSEIVWSVLTDYNRMADFVSSIRSSRVLNSDKEASLVEQVMSGKAGIFRKKIHLTLEVKETPPSQILFQDVAKKSFKSYEGTWAITEKEGQMEINYHLKAKPNFYSPDFLAKNAFKKTVETLLTEVRSEIASKTDRQK